MKFLYGPVSIGIFAASCCIVGQAQMASLNMNFNDGSSVGWTPKVTSGWNVVNGVYQGTNTSANTTVETVWSGGYNWTDYSVTADMSLQGTYAPADAQLVFRYLDQPWGSQHFGACRLMNYGGITLQLLDIGGALIASTPFPAQIGAWYTLKASIVGTLATCEVVGYPGTRIAGTFLGNSKGTIGLRATHSPVWFDNVKVTPLSEGAGLPSLSVANPFRDFVSNRWSPPVLDVRSANSWPPATALAADGMTAVVLVYQSGSAQPVTFSVSAAGPGLAGGTPVGALGSFESDYLISPSPPAGSPQTLPGVSPSYCAGVCTFLALLWAPNVMPAPGNYPMVYLTVTATQPGVSASAQSLLALEPPPVLLIHGIWSNAAGAGFTKGSGGLYDWIEAHYPHNLVFGVDYGKTSSKTFEDPATQTTLLRSIDDALASAAAWGMAVRRVDVVAHSMGGLVARDFLEISGASANPALPANPIHKLVTIGTPHRGSQLASTLVTYQYLPTYLLLIDLPPLLRVACGLCTLGEVMSKRGMPVDTGVESLQPTSHEIQSLFPDDTFDAIVGEAPTNPESCTESLLNVLISAYLPFQTVSGIFGHQTNDTIVPVSSQSPMSPGEKAVTIFPGIVHASACGSDIDETHSLSVWGQVLLWLEGGPEQISGSGGGADMEMLPRVSSAPQPAPVLDLSGFTEVAASNVTITPASSSTWVIGRAANITATSSTKTISELLLIQTVVDPSDSALLFATQSPFTVAFTPLRTGSTTFGAITVYTDNTYSISTLNYSFQLSGSPSALSLFNAPASNLSMGDSTTISAMAQFPGGLVDVSSVATYSLASGTHRVLQSSAAGAISAAGDGIEILNVSYGGLTVSTTVAVGSCAYALGPSNQILPYTGGGSIIQVTTTPDCAWIATGGASWLTINGASGTGSGTILLSAPANSTGSARATFLTLASESALVTQPISACAYTPSRTQIDVPSVSITGTLSVTTACPVTASSDSDWLTAIVRGSTVEYTISPNFGPSRSAVLTIGTAAVPVTQSSPAVCDATQDGNIDVADIQMLVNEVLATKTAAHDLNRDGSVNVVDVQFGINAALALGCWGQ